MKTETEINRRRAVEAVDCKLAAFMTVCAAAVFGMILGSILWGAL